jgi:1-acyl-sn-glycerol-3-phosphate acyltransferase
VSDSESDKRKRPAARRARADAGRQRDGERAAPGAAPSERAEGAGASGDKAARRVAARPGKSRKAARPAAPAVARPEPAAPGRGGPALRGDALPAAPPPEPATEERELPGHDMERDLAGLLRDIDGVQDDAAARRRAAEAIGRIAARLYPDAPAALGDEEPRFSSARQLLSTDYYLRHWSRIGLRGRSEHVDDFGLDPTYEARVQPLLDALYARYFRVEIEGAQHIPAQGGAVLVCNHSGTLPWDGVMLKTALRHARPDRRALRWLTDDFVFHSPFLGSWLNRIGAVRACPENADRLLEQGELLAVFPEGVKGIGKPYRERYQLQRFGRGGHVKLALRKAVPLMPVAIVGAEETYPLLYKVRAFSKLLGVPFVPITPLFPWLGPLGLIPLPSRWRIVIGEAMHELDGFEKRADDTVLVNDLNEQVRNRVQALLQDALQARGQNAFF